MSTMLYDENSSGSHQFTICLAKNHEPECKVMTVTLKIMQLQLLYTCAMVYFPKSSF